ncbi:MAG: Hpt domain-containing protein [Pseudomonadota bacterium]
MIDWNRVAELRDEIGAEDFGEVVDLFLDEVEGIVAKLDAAPVVAELEEDLHFLKGSALNLGFSEFGAICQAGEKAAARGEGSLIDISQVVTAYWSSKTAFMERADEFGIAA